MYRYIVRRLTERSFENVSNGEYDAVLRGCAPTIRHRFVGDHALGGVRRDREGFGQWLERVGRLSPDFRFEVHDVFVKGFPWNTRVVVRWTKHDTMPNGEIQDSWGVHFITLRWGRVVAIDVYPDTAGTTNDLARLADRGVSEAAAAPITS